MLASFVVSPTYNARGEAVLRQEFVIVFRAGLMEPLGVSVFLAR
jgi:hypothetical protein